MPTITLSEYKLALLRKALVYYDNADMDEDWLYSDVAELIEELGTVLLEGGFNVQ